MIKILSIFLISFFVTSCDWISLAYHAAAYQTTSSGEVANVVATDSYGFATMAEQGLGIFDLNTKKQIKIIPPPPGSESIDDLALDQNLLFILDAKIPGHLSVYSLSDPQSPELVSGPIEVPGEPFSGVSAGSGLVIVSGGTKQLSLRTYDEGGKLGDKVIETDLGRGQPDVLVSANGKQAYVSTHYSGPKFGFSILNLQKAPLGLSLAGQMELPGAGFTEGGYKPANFPIEMSLIDHFLLIAHSKGMAVMDIQKPKFPKLVQLFPLDISAVNIDVSEHTAAVVGASSKPKVILLDLSIPHSPKILSVMDLPKNTHTTGVALTPHHVVVAAQEKGVLIFDR